MEDGRSSDHRLGRQGLARAVMDSQGSCCQTGWMRKWTWGLLALLGLGSFCWAQGAAVAPKTLANWYQVKELKPDLFQVYEPSQVSFYILRAGDQAILIDSGLGLSLEQGRKLLQSLGIKKFKVLVTHAHCDHVGLNSIADEVQLSRAEWKKYLNQKEYDQIKIYYQLFKNDYQWPTDMVTPPTQTRWKPTGFVEAGKEISLGKWKIKPMITPGHSAGHTVFYESSSNILFLGDLIYDGMLYLHLKDSALKSFEKSVNQVVTLVGEKKPLLLPAHNSIPLDVSYPSKVQKVLSALRHGELTAKEEWPSSEVFAAAKFFESDGVKLAVKVDDLPKKSK